MRTVRNSYEKRLGIEQIGRLLISLIVGKNMATIMLFCYMFHCFTKARKIIYSKPSIYRALDLPEN